MSYRVAFQSLGCAKNLVNTEQMMALCREAGFAVTGDPDGADVAVLNTCGFIETAKSEAIDAILELAVDATQTVAVEVFPAEANDVPLDDFDWWSDDEAVARVSDAGVIKGIGIGETTIHYRRGDIFKEITVVVDTSFPLIKGQRLAERGRQYSLKFFC